MKYPPDQILTLFSQKITNTSTHHELKAFVEEYFYPAGSDLVDVNPTDWVPNPTFIDEFNNSHIKEFGRGIHEKWKTLVREWNNSFCDGCFSHLPVDRPFVIAGSRFREFYYWDTYWTMQGLLVSGMLNTTKGVLLNFLELVKELGFLPNGGRIYYLNRSQPPMLTQMVDRYFAVTADIEFLEQALPILNMEYEYWMTNTSVEPQPGYILNRYYVINDAPRPESYFEDVTLAATLPADQAPGLYQQLSTGAETGWDFSSRWMSNEPYLASLITTEIIPLDLNSILYKNEIVLAGFYKILKQPDMQLLYEQRSQKRLAAIQDLLWNDATGFWNDRYLNGTFDTRYYGSIWYPFWAGAFGDLTSEDISYMIQNLSEVLSYPGGVPVSTLQTGQQWDFPNGWAPLQYLAIEGLNTIANTQGLDPSLRSQCAEIAQQIVSRWLTSNYCAWNVTGLMYEKYDVTTRGIPGGGGEYTVQSGFGWTNGVALHFLQLYGNTFTLETCGTAPFK
eukprot:Phypoly_transcript_06269.p1 GENE.Phypoly_transcript_06269~~Phypoly_transcript_06269.p1  ORF type:complete len:584 (+),score=67.80 Phypoly_transcript_06269:239-1753(+)